MSHLQIDDPITFKFNCNFEFSSAKPRQPADFFDQTFSFNMVYDCVFCLCSLQIRQGILEGTNDPEEIGWETNVTLNVREAPREVGYSMIIYDSERNEIIPSTRLRTIFKSGVQDYNIPEGRSPLSLALGKCHLLKDVTRCYVDLCLLVTGSTSDFVFNPCYPAPFAPPPPAREDYRFEALRNTNLHNVFIHCLDGTISASKEALFQISAHFRDWPREMVENASCRAVDELLCFMMTETWSHPGDMTRKHIAELLMLMDKYKPIREDRLCSAIEKHLLWQLFENRHDLRQVLNLFIVAYREPKRLRHLGFLGAAVIYHLHKSQYLMNFTAATAANRIDHALIADLHLEPPPGANYQPINKRLGQLFEETRHVQLIIENERFRFENE